MAVFKCKMCGGDIEVTEGKTVAECEYCGTKQTLPTVNGDRVAALFNRANLLRQKKCEFDKAEQIYEKIIDEDEKSAEAYWGALLCKYGIEYVEDPKSYKMIPTCHRTHYEPMSSDVYFESAVRYADTVQRVIYEEEARVIDGIIAGAISVCEGEEPYDVFICYKETDELMQRTKDSGIANEVYYQLTDEGYKVFFAPVTLKDKLGSEYEPYIFAALTSAKVMVVIGTKPEYLEAVWVKNEWSRFLKMMENDRKKKLIPCYADMEAYELPDEIAHFPTLNMSGMGFIRELVRGIGNIVEKKRHAVVSEASPAATVQNAVNVDEADAFVRRAMLFLSDMEWDKALEYSEKALDIAPEFGKAYLAKAMYELKCDSLDTLKTKIYDAVGNKNFRHAVDYDAEILAMSEEFFRAAEETKRREEERLRAEEEARRRAEAELQRRAEEEARQKRELLKRKRCELEKYQQLLGMIVGCTVAQTGSEVWGQGWTNVKNSGFSAGINADGTVTLSPDDPELTWYDYSYGGYRKIDYIYHDDWKEWKDISSLTAYGSKLYAVTEDGEILSNGEDYHYTYEWKLKEKVHDVLFAVLGNDCIAILSADGRACFYGIKYWKAYDDGIVAVGALSNNVWFMHENGEIKVYDNNGPKLVEKVDLENKTVDELLQELITKKEEEEAAAQAAEAAEAEAAAEEKKKQELMSWWRSIKVCRHCGGDFKGLVVKVCSRCGRKKDY